MTWQITSFTVLAIVLLGGFLWYERSRPPARVVALVAALVALAVVGRLAFAAVPNVKPVTDIVLFAGYALGGVPGFAVGALTALVSNVFFGQGPWTPWQMVAWGGVGLGGALMARYVRDPGRIKLAIACALAGLAFGAFMDVYQWTLAARQDLPTYFAVAGTSAGYNAAHVIGNVVFCLLIGPAFVRALLRFRRRFEVTWEAPPRPAVVATLVALLALGVGLTAAPPASAASAPAKAARYLERSQNKDGGFGATKGSRSSQLFSGWSALGLAAAGKHPADVRRRGGRTALSYLLRGSRSLKDVGELERTILVVAAAGKKPRSFKGRDLVAEMLRHKRSNGSFDGFVSYTAFGVLALRAAGEKPSASTLGWLGSAQHSDGGFSVSPQGRSDADMTGVVLQALAAVGRGNSSTAQRAVGYLRKSQNGDGGYGQFGPTGSNAQSTSYAVLGLSAVGARGATLDRALGYIKRLQRPDGSVRYSAGSSQTPVWVTAQALMAMKKKALPYRALKRKKRKRRGSRSTPAVAASDGDDAAPGNGSSGGTAGKEGKGESSAAGSEAPAAGGATEGGSDSPVARKNASAEASEGISPWMYGGGVALALLLVLAARRWLLGGRTDGGSVPTTWS